MKNKVISIFLIIFFIFTFLVFYQSLNKSSSYKPKNEIKNIPEFSSVTFFKKKNIESKNIFNQNKYYLFNIWASWCLPCRDEHPLLLKLSKNDRLEIIGLNYKDKFRNAEEFLKDLGNPYKKILLDNDGTQSIEWGAIGVPETFLIYQNKILKKFIGPLNNESIEEIKEIIK